ncbi:hypothetical protein ACXJY6_08865 [Vibrio sp. RC27]
MDDKSKKLSNPVSTGGGGGHFEAHIQSSFVVLMLTGGYAPCLPAWPIKEVKLQGKIDGYDTDDLIVCIENASSGEVRKLLGQVKHSIKFTKGNSVLSDVFIAAWTDFKNKDVFQRNKDVIALITGPVTAVDQNNVQWLLNQAKSTKDAAEFFRHVRQANFSPSKAEEKLDVLRFHLKIANSDTDVTDDELYEFINHFYLLGYDVGGETGVVLPLLHSHISQFHQQYPKMVWGRIVDVVQTWNQHAGTVTLDKLPDDVIEVFSQLSIVEKMPEELHLTELKEEMDWRKHKASYDLALIALIGGWNENNENDLKVLSSLLNMDYEKWLSKAREILHHPESPLKLKNGIWKVEGKGELINLLGSQILDSNLDCFKTIAENVLSEQDPAFELEKEKRYAASVYGKVLEYSVPLRKGVSEGLALLGSQPNKFANCTVGKPESIAVLAVRELLSDAPWQQWATLNNLLPDLSEAAPGEFLNQIESALFGPSCVFDNLFEQESSGISGGNYLTGLLWALEGLAWKEQNLVRVCCSLSDLATHDPGGNWSNRPINSLITILLPWLPQTLAPVDKRKTAVKTIVAENPNIGWKLLLKLLPGQHQTSSGSHKPKWQNVIPKGWDKGVSNQEYWEQVSFYSTLAVELAGDNLGYALQLIDNIGHLIEPAQNEFLQRLSSVNVQHISKEEQRQVWDKLTSITAKHRKFSDSKWALSDELLTRIEIVSERFAPENIFNLYQYLFSESDFNLYEEKGNWEEQRKKLDRKREDAVRELLSEQGLRSIVDFVDKVPSSREVGRALGVISDPEIDIRLLPEYLITKDPKRGAFIGAYLWSRRYLNGWKWADEISKDSWTTEQIGQFLAYLPFEQEAWDRADAWLKGADNYYWTKTPANGYQTDDDLHNAIEKLIVHERPRAAVDCLGKLRFDKKPINSELCIRALLAGVSSKEPPHTLDQHNIIELIKHLQSNPDVDETGLFRVEWAYLSLLDGFHDATPTLLENKLANEPNFFCELIQLVYRSTHEEKKNSPLQEEKRAIAKNAWSLLHHWHTPPGTQKDGEFNPSIFDSWIRYVKDECIKSGHLDIAMITIGNVLIHASADDSGLWINKSIAKELNSKNGESMRLGYSTGTFNSRGAHTVDPTGKPEKELATQFYDKADKLEDEGYFRFATVLREIADDYKRQADRVISEHFTE